MRHRLLALVLLLAACGAPGASPSIDPEGSWQLVEGSVDGAAIPLVEDHPITLTLQDSGLSGVAACNEYGGRIVAVGGGVRLEELFRTAAGCAAEIQAAEQAYMNAMERLVAIGSQGEELVLSGRNMTMRFVRLPEAPVEAVLGTEWILETLFVGDVASPAEGDAATLVLSEDGELTGSTGCRTFTGTWVQRGNQIVATTLAMGQTECPAELAGQDGHVVGVIGDGFVPSVEGDLLTLTDPGSVGLVFRAGS
jgi:heat shock protein HslJ